MSKKKILSGAERKAQMLEAGAKLAAKHGAENVTRRMVATACGCAEALVSVYMGDSASAKKAYTRKAKALGLVLPDKATAEAIGVKLRAHGPRDKRDSRKRSVKEVEAIKRKANSKPKSKRAATDCVPNPKAKPAPQNKALPGAPENKAQQERKTAARKPKAPPASLPLPQSS